MLDVIESGLRVRLPDGSAFRIQDLPAYNSLRGLAISEMDFGWWDESKRAVHLLEVKNLTHPRSAPDREDLARKLRSNVKDTLVLFHAAWARTGKGASLCAELPEACRTRAALSLFFVLKLPVGSSSLRLLGSLQDVVAMAARGYAELLGLEVKAVVLSHERASEAGLPISAAPHEG